MTTSTREHTLAQAVDDAKRAWDEHHISANAIKRKLDAADEELSRVWFRARAAWEAHVRRSARRARR